MQLLQEPVVVAVGKVVGDTQEACQCQERFHQGHLLQGEYLDLQGPRDYLILAKNKEKLTNILIIKHFV